MSPRARPPLATEPLARRPCALHARAAPPDASRASGGRPHEHDAPQVANVQYSPRSDPWLLQDRRLRRPLRRCKIFLQNGRSVWTACGRNSHATRVRAARAQRATLRKCMPRQVRAMCLDRCAHARRAHACHARARAPPTCANRVRRMCARKRRPSATKAPISTRARATLPPVAAGCLKRERRRLTFQA